MGSVTAGLPIQKVEAADKIDELNKKSEELKKERSGVESKINSMDSEINKLKGEQKNVGEEIKRLDFAIGDAENKISEKTSEIAATKEEIKELQGDIKVLEERIAKRNDTLKDRARSYQESGGMVSYIDVLMGAQSFSDFIDRVGAVATIVEADTDILKEHQADKDLLEEKRTKVEKDLASLEQMLKDLENMKKELSTQKAEKDKLMASLKKEEEHMHAEMLDLQEEKDIISGQEAAIQKAIQLEKEQQKRAAEAAAAQAEKAAKAQGNSASSNSNNTSNTKSTTSSKVSAPPVSNGTFTKPASGRLSSGFGGRSLGNHFGVDIASGGTVPIVAAADGVVIRSYYSSSYGNCIFIAHSINGQVYTTVYAHMRSRGIGSGATVKKGQQIGIMGNTGQSYGQHLHFELHKGSWNGAKSNAINPIGIVPL